MNKEIKIFTSEIKEGDVIQCGSNVRSAWSNAYLCKETGCWSVDISKDYRYGWETADRIITVTRHIKKS
tara:strand:+ start:43 stop:249 length:207 start_codon:yes stop_codon:yes gene_type:complete